QHRLVLGAADDPAVGGGRGHPRGVCEQVGKPTGARHGVGVRVVVRQDQGTIVTLGDLEELPQPVADQELGRSEIWWPVAFARRGGIAHGRGGYLSCGGGGWQRGSGGAVGKSPPSGA